MSGIFSEVFFWMKWVAKAKIEIVSSLQDSTDAHKKAHKIRSTPSLKSFPNTVFETSYVHLIDNPFKEDRQAFPLFKPPSSGQLMVWILWCPWLCAQSMCLKLLNISDLPRCKPPVMVALPASLSAQSFPFNSGMSMAALPQEYLKVDVKTLIHVYLHASVGFPFHFL